METLAKPRGRPRATPGGTVNVTITVPVEVLQRVRDNIPQGEISRAAVAGLVRACEERERDGTR